ncbi:MAG: DUF4411 family protein [Roseovarius sp.]|nr:DUF4411 family protein [Roseovarius sp.]
MATPRFSIDTSCLVNAWNRTYQIEILPSIWEHVESIVRDEIAVITVQVYDEIKRKDDDLAAWCNERKDMFWPIDEDHIERLRGIMERYPRIASAGSGRNFADPWVIALAQCFDPFCCVVTEEGLSRRETNPKIPFVCEGEGLTHCTFNKLLRETGWSERR